MMRLILCVSDQPETGGYIEPKTAGILNSIMGHAIAHGGRHAKHVETR
jgi:hypothetical protein